MSKMFTFLCLVLLHFATIVNGKADMLSISTNVITSAADWKDIWSDNDEWETVDYLELFDGERLTTKCVDYFCLCEYHYDHKHNKHNKHSKKLYECNYFNSAKTADINTNNYEIYYYHNNGYDDYDKYDEMSGLQLGFKPEPHAKMPPLSEDAVRAELVDYFVKYNLAADTSHADQDVHDMMTDGNAIMQSRITHKGHCELSVLEIAILYKYTSNGVYATELKKSYQDTTRDPKEIYFQDMLINSATHKEERFELWARSSLLLYVDLEFQIPDGRPITDEPDTVWHGPISTSTDFESALVFGQGHTIFRMFIPRGSRDEAIGAIDVGWI